MQQSQIASVLPALPQWWLGRIPRRVSIIVAVSFSCILIWAVQILVRAEPATAASAAGETRQFVPSPGEGRLWKFEQQRILDSLDVGGPTVLIWRILFLRGRFYQPIQRALLKTAKSLLTSSIAGHLNGYSRKHVL